MHKFEFPLGSKKKRAFMLQHVFFSKFITEDSKYPVVDRLLFGLLVCLKTAAQDIKGALTFHAKIYVFSALAIT